MANESASTKADRTRRHILGVAAQLFADRKEAFYRKLAGEWDAPSLAVGRLTRVIDTTGGPAAVESARRELSAAGLL